MTKVFPNAPSSSSTGENSVLTVWKKSMLLNCDGFTVFNGNGNLVYRVDNYIAANKAEILLMDAAGNPLFTVRRKRGLILSPDTWLVYDGETAANPRFSAKKYMINNIINLLNYYYYHSKCLARVSHVTDRGTSVINYEIEGCYGKRCCAIYDDKRRIVAEIKRKEAAAGGRMSFGSDVFRLVVHPPFETAQAMALLVLLDQMFPQSKNS